WRTHSTMRSTLVPYTTLFRSLGSQRAVMASQGSWQWLRGVNSSLLLPLYTNCAAAGNGIRRVALGAAQGRFPALNGGSRAAYGGDRERTRLNSSHGSRSYPAF